VKEEVDKTDLISFINYQPRTRALHEQAKLEVHKIVARNHGFDYKAPDAFDEWDTINTVDQVGKIFDAMNMFLGSVGLVTLALGAIGIINIMLVAVADRTREIGLRKAIGATNRSIMFQFFVEGAFLTLLSGGLGMAGPPLMAALASPSSRFDPPKLVPAMAALAMRHWRLLVYAGLYSARRAAFCSRWKRFVRNRYVSRSATAYGAMRHDLRKTLRPCWGMAWGIATVVLLLAYGDGFGRAITNIFRASAPGRGVFPGRPAASGRV
jgi:predicted lysophospholipase L1 biosynthesis ABC-type transport system permease subunit